MEFVLYIYLLELRISDLYIRVYRLSQILTPVQVYRILAQVSLFFNKLVLRFTFTNLFVYFSYQRSHG